MKVLVTVGTTPFDSLVRCADKELSCGIDLFIQNATGDYKPQAKSKSFFDSPIDFYREFDVIVTHAGAGSIYNMLEIGSKVVVVPNLDRIDKHQMEISKYVEVNGYALVCWDLLFLREVVEKAFSYDFNAYQSEAFFKFKEIGSIIDDCF